MKKFILFAAAIAICCIGCSHQEKKSEKDNSLAFEQRREDEAFAKAHGAVWITTNLNPAQPKLTVDFQDGLFSEGSPLACDLLVSDVQRENGVLRLTGVSLSTFGDFEIEITTNMLASIRAKGGSFSFVRVAFQVESFKRISEDSSERYLIRGKALAVE